MDLKIVEWEPIPVEEYIARHVDLIECGSGDRPYLKSLCPLHSEKNPSFYVYPNIQKWTCYSCQGGALADVIEFAKKFHGIGFLEARKLCCTELSPEDAIAKSLKFQPIEDSADTRVYTFRMYDLVESLGVGSVSVMSKVDRAISKKDFKEADNLLRNCGF